MSILGCWSRPSRVRRTVITLGTTALLAASATIAVAQPPLATIDSYFPANGSVVAGALPATIDVRFQDPFQQAGSARDPGVPAAGPRRVGQGSVQSAIQSPTDARQLVITTTDRTTPGNTR